jgi:hypothetical protein
MKNKIEDLRNHLFATLEARQDTEKPMEIDRARVTGETLKLMGFIWGSQPIIDVEAEL